MLIAWYNQDLHFCKQLLSKQDKVENSVLEMTRLGVSVVRLTSSGTSAELPTLCIAGFSVRQSYAVFSWSVEFSIVVVRPMLILIPVTGFVYSNVLQEERCLKNAVLIVPELSQLLFLSDKSRSHSVSPRLLNLVSRWKS